MANHAKTGRIKRRILWDKKYSIFILNVFSDLALICQVRIRVMTILFSCYFYQEDTESGIIRKFDKGTITEDEVLLCYPGLKIVSLSGKAIHFLMAANIDSAEII